MLGYLINKIDKARWQFLTGSFNFKFTRIALSKCTYAAHSI